MSEGEFKKQIAVYSVPFPNKEVKSDIQTSDVFKVIDLAAKEFPNINSEKYGSDEKRWIPWNYSAFNRDLLDWFTKWFGEQK